jgi:hypothetical protein
MDATDFSGLSFPLPTSSVFDRVVSVGWYDGTTSGLAVRTATSEAFAFELIEWGPAQRPRIFALFPLADLGFEAVVALLESSTASEKKSLRVQLEEHSISVESPEYVFASEDYFKTIITSKRLDMHGRNLLPNTFRDFNFFGVADDAYGSFAFWAKYLELSLAT